MTLCLSGLCPHGNVTFVTGSLTSLHHSIDSDGSIPVFDIDKLILLTAVAAAAASSNAAEANHVVEKSGPNLVL